MADYSEIKSLAMEVNAAFPDKEDLWNMVCTPSVALHLVADIERLKAENEALRNALIECADSLQGEMLQKFGGQLLDDMHPVTRREYDRDMAEVAGYRAALGQGEQS